MPDTPFPPGEPLSLRDSEVYWFEPVIDDADADASPLPGVDDRVEDMEAARRGRDQVPWREVSWVGFGGDLEAVESSEATPSAPFAPGSTDASAVPQDDRSRGEGETAAAPVAGPRRAGLGRRLGAGLARLAKLGGAAAAVAVLAAFLYHGGEQLAGLAVATPRVVEPPPQLPAAKPPAGAVAEDPPTPALPLNGPAAHYLDRAEAGEPAAQYNLAVLFARGDGVTRDFAAAAAWFRKAALAGNPAASFDLGVLYGRGLGVEQNMDEAVRWYRRAAEHSYPSAQYNLAIAYADGTGVPQDWVAAARWYHEAALRGIVPAMVNFAILYEGGQGVERSLPDAYAWYRAAARRGDAAAEQRAQALFKQFAGSDKARAVMLAAAVVDALREQPAAPAPPASPGLTVGRGGPPRSAKPGGLDGGTTLGIGPVLRQPSG